MDTPVLLGAGSWASRGKLIKAAARIRARGNMPKQAITAGPGARGLPAGAAVGAA